ncbi:tRNA-splicing endonuclease subunit Sen34-like [Centruroides sculpturatus]|uniref:tRNA-splicing endonuclease subunit Sen34-like n=2 Tax=Centruroides sculpturatus TaxID=218467 RepID=UPI000C6CE03B|nr:tRNA-splicing endonuclease subunit Sen34-like [Centruroides sculpturatus]
MLRQEFYKEGRRKEIYSMADKILEGKKKKLLKLKKNSSEQESVKNNETVCNETVLQENSFNEINCNTITRDSVIDEEMKKIKPISEDLCMVQLFTECPWKNMEVCKNDWQLMNSDKEKLQYAVFCNLWEKGYYITPGIKFGGDFLAYAGNPTLYHALYIIVCVQYEETFSPLRLIALSRLGTHVKKTAVLATVKPSGRVDYLSIKWEGSRKLDNPIKETDS